MLRRSIAFEPLEERCLLATLSELGSTLTVRLDQAGEMLAVTSLGSSYSLTSNHTIQNDSSNGVASGRVTFSGSSATVTTAGLAAYDKILVVDGTGIFDSKVTFNDSGSNAYTDHFAIVLGQDLNVSSGEQSIVFRGNSLFQGVNLDATTTRNIVVEPGANITTTNGGLGLRANDLGTTTGNFAGITVGAGSRVAGRATVMGTGGSSSGGSNHGVLVEGGTITSDGDSVLVVGNGGGSGTASSNVGIFVISGGQISAGGSGSVTVDGSGGGVGGTGSGNQGVRVQGGSVITSSGGPVLVTGEGGGSGSSVNNFGVYVFGNGTITAGGSGSVTIEGTGGGGSGLGNDGVFVDDVGAKITSGVAGVQVTGTPGSGTPGFGIRVGSLGTISTAPSGGAIALTADRIAIDGTVNAGTSSAALKTKSSGVAINLGSTTDTAENTLEISDAELDRITAGCLALGATNSGPITVTQPIAPAGAGTLSLNTGVNVSQSAPITVPNLAVVAQGNILLGMPTNDVDVFAARSSTGLITFTDTDDLAVGAVASLSGVSTGGARVSITGRGDVTIHNTSAVDDVVAAGSPDFTHAISIFVDSPSGRLTIADGAKVQSTGGFHIYKADKMDLAGTIGAAGQTVILQPLQNTQAIDLGSTTDAAANALEISDAELDRITAGTLQVGDSTTGALSVSQAISITNANSLHLIGGSAVTQSAPISVANLAVEALSNVTLDMQDNEVDNLAIASAAGGVQYRDATGFTVTTVDGLAGIRADGQDVGLVAKSGNLTVANTAATDDIFGALGINITLVGAGALLTTLPEAVLRTGVGGNANLLVDRMDLGGTIAAGGQTVSLQSWQNTRIIDLGSTADTTANTLALSDAELDRITANTLRIGNNAAGAITISQSISVTNANNLHLIGGSGISQSGAITVPKLAAEVQGNILLGMPTNDVDVFAARSSTGLITLTDIDDLAVGTVASLSGASAGGARVSLTGRGDVTIHNTSAVDDVAAAGSPDFTHAISIFVDSPSGRLTIADGANVQSAGGFHIYKADKMDLAGTIGAAGQTVMLQPLQNTQAINLGSTTDAAANTLEISDAELDRITAGTLQVGDSTAVNVAGPITRAAATNLSLITGGANDISFAAAGSIDAGGGNVTLSTGTGLGSGGIVVNLGNAANVTANALSIIAGARGVAGPGGYLTTAVNSIAASCSNSAIRIKEVDTVSIASPGLNGGLIHLEGGTFQYSADNLIDDTVDVDVRPGAALNLGEFSDAIRGLIVYGASSGPAASVSTGSGVLTVGSNGIGYGYFGATGAVGASVSGNLSFGGAVREINVPNGSAAADLTISAAITSGGIRKTGEGTLKLIGGSSYGGATFVDTGVLAISHAGALGATSGGTTVAGGAALELDGSITVVGEPLIINASGISGTGALRSKSGTNVWQGTVELGLAGGGGIGVDGGSELTVSGQVSGRTLAKWGTGRLILTESNTYTGVTEIIEGALQIRHGSALGATSAGTTVHGGAAWLELIGGAIVVDESLRLNGGFSPKLINVDDDNTWRGSVTLGDDATISALAGALKVEGVVDNGGHLLTLDVASSNAAAIWFSADITGTGGLKKIGTGPGEAFLSAPTTYSGLTSIIEGQVRLMGNATLGDLSQGTKISPHASVFFDTLTPVLENFVVSGYGFQNSGTIRARGGATLSGSVVLQGNSRFESIFETDAFTIEGSVTDQGNGFGIDAYVNLGCEIVVTGANTYSGPTTVTSLLGTGTLRVGSSGAIPAVSDVALSEGASLDLNGFDQSVASLAGAGNVNLRAGTLTTGGDNSSTFFTGSVSGSGNVIKQGSGVWTLFRANTYSGATRVDGGTLRVDGSLAAESAVTVNSGAVLGGRGAINGSVTVTSGGMIAPGTSPSILATGNVTFQAGSAFNVEIGGAIAGDLYDQLLVTGSVAIDGNVSLNLSSLGGFIPAIGQTFTLVNNDGATPNDLTGEFAGLPEGAIIENFLGSDLNAAVSYHGGNGNDITLTVVSPNTPPVADAGGPYSIDEGSILMLDGGASTDVNGNIGSYEWDLDYDGITFDADSTGITSSASFADNFESRTIAVRVTDMAGEFDIATTTLTVINVAPTLAVDPITPIDEGGAAVITGNAGDVGLHDTLTVTIEWGDGDSETFGIGDSPAAGTLYGLSTADESLYKIDPATGAATLVAPVSGRNLSWAGAAFLNGELYVSGAAGADGFHLGKVDLITGAFTPVNNMDGDLNWWGLAADESAGLLYTVDSDTAGTSNNFTLKAIDAAGNVTSVAQQVFSLPFQSFGGLAYDSATGLLYGVGQSGGNLYTIDKSTGARTLIGPTGLSGASGLIGLELVPETGVLYATTSTTIPGSVSGPTSLYSLNRSTGAATLIGATGANTIDGLAWLATQGIAGAFSKDHVYADNGVFEVTITVTDDDGSSTSTTRLVTVNNVAPVAQDDHAVTDENTVLNVAAPGLLENDTDVGALDVLSVTGIDTSGTQGTITANFDGSFTYDPAGKFDYLGAGEVATDTIRYTISDGHGGIATGTASITIIGDNDPPVADAGGYYTIFEGEPLPLNGSASSDADDDFLSYSWDLNDDGIFGDATGPTLSVEWAALQALSPSINDDGSYEITLRVSDATTYIHSLTKLQIVNAPPSVTISTVSDTIVPGEPVPFVLSAQDVSAADQAGQFTYFIDWTGDGIVDETVFGPSSVVVQHVYTEAVNPVPSVAAVDKDGAVSLPTSHELVIKKAKAVKKKLSIGGSTGSDNVQISQGSVVVRFFDPAGNLLEELRFEEELDEIVVYGQDGDDRIQIDPAITQPVEIFAGPGNDTIQAGGGPSILHGEEGNDTLIGGSSTNALDGGDGDDIIEDGGGVNTVIGGPGANTFIPGGGTNTFETAGATATPGADPPQLVLVSHATGNEGAAIPLRIWSGLTDTGGSETLSLRITGVPTNAILSAGQKQSDGSWRITTAGTSLDLSGLTLTAGDNAAFDLSVTAIATLPAGASASTTGLIHVDVHNVAPAANAGGPYLTFEDVPVTLSASGTDAAGILDPLKFAWDLDKNGSFETMGASVVFDPAALGLTGSQTHTVKLRVTDDENAETITSTTVRILGQGITQVGGVVYVVSGPTTNDVVTISPSGNKIRVVATFNNNTPVDFAESSVNEIYVRSRGGNDVVNAGSIAKPMTIDGGSGNDVLNGGTIRNTLIGDAGNDVLNGGAGDDILLGGAGNDTLNGAGGNNVLSGGDGNDSLTGSSGRDLLIGGNGNDSLSSGAGEDILVGGFTLHDNNIAALDAIMAVWKSTASFESRVATLTATGGHLRPASTVFDDDAPDSINGSTGRDLIFGDNSKLDGVMDSISLEAALDTLFAVV